MHSVNYHGNCFEAFVSGKTLHILSFKCEICNLTTTKFTWIERSLWFDIGKKLRWCIFQEKELWLGFPKSLVWQRRFSDDFSVEKNFNFIFCSTSFKKFTVFNRITLKAFDSRGKIRIQFWCWRNSTRMYLLFYLDIFLI